jgi:hypothetical protein
MSSNSTKRSFAFPAVFVLSIALAGADIVVSAQDNQNNSNAEMQTSNMSNANTSGKRKGSRRGSKRASANANANANTTGDMTGNSNMAAGQENANTSATENTNATTGTTSTSRRKGRGRASSSTATGQTAAAGQPADISGTYTGVVNYPEGGLNGPATLAITGNQFTLTPEGGSPVSGRVSAVNTRGYTGVAMQLGDFTPTAPGQTAAAPPVSISARAKKAGSKLTLTPAPGAMHQFSFTPTGRAGGRRSKRAAAPTTEATTPTEATETTTAPKPSGRKGRRGSRGNANTNAAGETNTNTGNTNTGAANANNSNQ